MSSLERFGAIFNAAKDLIVSEIRYIPFPLATKRNIRVIRQAVRNGELDRGLMVRYRRSVSEIVEANRAIRERNLTQMHEFNKRLKTLPQRRNTISTEQKVVYSHTSLRLTRVFHEEARKILWGNFKKSIGLK